VKKKKKLSLILHIKNHDILLTNNNNFNNTSFNCYYNIFSRCFVRALTRFGVVRSIFLASFLLHVHEMKDAGPTRQGRGKSIDWIVRKKKGKIYFDGKTQKSFIDFNGLNCQ
jgi:hypothetical protein